MVEKQGGKTFSEPHTTLQSTAVYGLLLSTALSRNGRCCTIHRLARAFWQRGAFIGYSTAVQTAVDHLAEVVGDVESAWVVSGVLEVDHLHGSSKPALLMSVPPCM